MSERPLWTVLSEVDQRAGELALTLPLLSVSKLHGVVRYKDLFPDRVIRADDLSHYKVVETGQIVLNKMSAATGAVGRAEEQGLVSPDYAVLSPSDDCDSRYLKYLLGSEEFCKNRVEPRLQGIGIGDVSNARTPRVTTMSYLSIVAFLPEVQMQTKIVDYLDRETGEIDAMLATLDVLTEALHSRRASVVERETVARLGRLTRLKFCADVSLGKTFQGVRKSDCETLLNYVRAASIQPNGLELDDQRMWMTQEEQRKYDLRKGDILIVEGGAGFGRSVHLTQDMPGWGFQNHVIRVRPDQYHDGRFLNYCVKGHYSGGLIALLADGATIPGLSSDKAKNLPIPDMSLEEQQRIADHLDEVTGRIDAMLATIDELKALLVERRSALITDVVTGRKKIPS